jgi:hypothetical protein
MAHKENKGGILTNEEVEQDLEVKGQQAGTYTGSQDTGDKNVRQTGTDVQKADGRPAEPTQNEEK